MNLIYTYDDFKEKLNTIFSVYKNKTAIACVGDNGVERQITYVELQEIANTIIGILQKQKIERAQRVAVITPPTAEAVVLNLALAYGGYTNVLIDASLPTGECNKLLEYADVDAIFTTEAIYNQLDSGLKDEIPVIEIDNSFAYHLFTEITPKCKKKNIEPYDQEVVAIVFSSGTTAEMKGVMVTYNSVLYAQKCICKYAQLHSKEKFLDVLPSNHIAGYSSSISCLLTGMEVGFIKEMNADKLMAGFRNYNPTNFIMIPKVYEVIKSKMEAAISKKPFPVKMYAKVAMKICGKVREKTGINLRLLTKPIWKTVFGANIRICGCGTLPCSEEIIRFYLDLGIDFLNVYGATETGFPITAADCNEKYPLKGAGNVKQFEEIDIRIFEPDAEGIGEIRIKTPLIMKGYFRDEELTKQAFDEAGYFKTGDLGYIDDEGYLYVTGRMKEAIVLHNGKKVSPIDVDKYYQKGVQDITLASCGVGTSEGYDHIYLFVEKGHYTQVEMDVVVSTLQKMSDNASLYRVEKVLVIDKMPTTTVGKVRRFMLKNLVDAEHISVNNSENEKKTVGAESKEEVLLRLVSKYASGEAVTLNSCIESELAIDSLGMFELSIEIENELGIDVTNCWDSIRTVGDILCKSEECDSGKKDYEIQDFPLKKSKKDLSYIKRVGNISGLIYKLDTVGVENIPVNENVLFCPNHESYFDAMWVATALLKNGFDISKICCLAAEHLKDKPFMKRAFRALGGIPVDRGGNTVPAMKRAEEILGQENSYMIVHPEGTRSRSGMLGEFKLGAAQLAKETGVKIIPVCIDGAYEIYPPSAKLPRCFDGKKLRRYQLKIAFGEVIDVDSLTKEEITEKIKSFIVEQKTEN